MSQHSTRQSLSPSPLRRTPFLGFLRTGNTLPTETVERLLMEEKCARRTIVAASAEARCRLDRHHWHLFGTLQDEALAAVRIEELLDRERGMDAYDAFAAQATLFHRQKTLAVRVAGCPVTHANGARRIWMCQALVRNELYVRWGVHEEEMRLRAELESIGRQEQRAVAVELRRRRGDARAQASLSFLLGKPDEREITFVARALYALQEAHSSSRTRLEWEEELAAKAIRCERCDFGGR